MALQGHGWLAAVTCTSEARAPRNAAQPAAESPEPDVRCSVTDTEKHTHTCTSVAILAQAFWLKPFCLKRVSFDYELLTQ